MGVDRCIGGFDLESLPFSHRVRAERILVQYVSPRCIQLLQVISTRLAVKLRAVPEAALAAHAKRNDADLFGHRLVCINMCLLRACFVCIDTECHCLFIRCLIEAVIVIVGIPHIRIRGNLLQHDPGGFFLFNKSEHISLQPLTVALCSSADINMYSRHIREGFGRDTAPVSIDQRAQIIPYVRAVVGDPRQFRIPHGEGFMAGSICHFPGIAPESSVFCQVFPIAVEHSKVVKLEQYCIRDDLDTGKDGPGGKSAVIRDHAQTGVGISVLIADIDRCGVTGMSVDIFSDPECLIIDLTLFTDDCRSGGYVSAGRNHTVCRAGVGPVKFPGCHPDLFQFKNLRG